MNRRKFIKLLAALPFIGALWRLDVSPAPDEPDMLYLSIPDEPEGVELSDATIRMTVTDVDGTSYSRVFVTAHDLRAQTWYEYRGEWRPFYSVDHSGEWVVSFDKVDTPNIT